MYQTHAGVSDNSIFNPMLKNDILLSTHFDKKMDTKVPNTYIELKVEI